MPRKKKTEETEEKNETKSKAEAEPKKALTADEKKAKLEKLLKKAKALEGKVEEKEIDIKKKIKEEKEGDEQKEKNMLVPIEDYLKSSIHLGTRVITPDMKDYVYRRRADGLSVFNTTLLDEKIKEGAEFLSNFAPDRVIVICKREAGWKAVEKFAQTVGMRFFTKKYPAGILTNTMLQNFTETDLIFICDPWLDKNAFNDALKIKIPVLSICDTNNYTRGITQIIPGNNKSAKSLGMIFYLVTKIYSEKRKLGVEIPKIQEFIDDWDNLQPPK